MLRRIREQAGYSQQNLAEKSGVSQHTISEIELGRRKPQGRTLRRLAQALGVSPREFLGQSWAMAMPEDAFARYLESTNLDGVLALIRDISGDASNARGEERVRILERLGKADDRFRSIAGPFPANQAKLWDTPRTSAQVEESQESA
jgi:transcriptional regulator with XRE-family HTH domain